MAPVYNKFCGLASVILLRCRFFRRLHDMADEDRRRAGAHTAGDRGDGIHDGFDFVKGYIADELVLLFGPVDADVQNDLARA